MSPENMIRKRKSYTRWMAWCTGSKLPYTALKHVLPRAHAHIVEIGGYRTYTVARQSKESLELVLKDLAVPVPEEPDSKKLGSGNC